jgi:maleate isomerase
VVQRVGLIIPSSNRMVEEEMIRFYPKDVVVHVTRLRMTGPHKKPLDQLLGDIETAAAALVDAKCNVVTFHCTVTSMSDGPAGETRILNALKTARAPFFATTSTAVRAALDACDAKRIALITPYDAHKTEEEIEFLEDAGYQVVYTKGYDLKNSDAYCSTPASVWRDRVLEARRPDVDAYFLSCANIQAIGEIHGLEEALGAPVLTSNQVVIWDGLRQVGLTNGFDGPGALFRKQRRPTKDLI